MSPADLRSARLRLGLSTDEAARVLGQSNRSTITRWENGERAIPEAVAILLAIADAVPGAREWLMERAPDDIGSVHRVARQRP